MKGRALATIVALAITACRTEIVFDDRTTGALDGSADAAVAEAGPVTCATDGECAVVGLYCDPLSSSCVECTTDAHCPLAERRRCSAVSHHCLACLSSSDCAAHEQCEAATGRCVRECAGTSPCPTDVSRCDTARGICAECTSDADCARPWKKRICDLAILTCVECADDTQCSGATSHCDRRDGTCAQCLSSSECPSSAPLCEPTTRACVGR